MSVYFDQMGHMRADTLDELHAFARRLGLRRAWFQDRPTHPHYDLTTVNARRRAKEAGAIEVTPREMVKLFRAATPPRTEGG